MSDRAREIVKWYSQSKNTARLLLFMIAEFAHLDGTGAYPSMATLCHITGMSLRNVQRLINELEASGELSVKRNGGPNKTHIFTIELDYILAGATEGLEPYAPRYLLKATQAVANAGSSPVDASLSETDDNLSHDLPEDTPENDNLSHVDDNLSPQQNISNTNLLDEPYKNLIQEPEKSTSATQSATPRSSKTKRPPSVSDDFRIEMREKYAFKAQREEVETAIDLALSHESAKKYTPVEGYVKNWLRREFTSPASNGRPRRPEVAGTETERYGYSF